MDNDQNFLEDESLRSMSGSFYPSGHVFAMFDSDSAARAAADELLRLGVSDARSAGPAQILAAWAKRAAEIGSSLPSVGREEQFVVRFVELAAQGGAGMLAKIDGPTSPESLQDALQRHRPAVAYYYRPLIIEEWVSPDSRAAEAGADAL